MKDFKVDVLGSEYNIQIVPLTTYPERFKTASGWTDFYAKKITVRDYEAEDFETDDFVEFTNRMIRHELMHAFMYESGMDICVKFARNEAMIDFIALQLPKIVRTMEKHDLLGRGGKQ